MKSDFYILGMPLLENTAPTAPTIRLIERCSLIIGESRRITERLLSRISLIPNAKVFYLDNQSPQEKKALWTEMKGLKEKGGTACLFSDMGMPILFDPGVEVLERAKELNYSIRCLPGPTSWGTACAISGWAPPFVLVGFLSPKAEQRLHELGSWLDASGHIVLMDTPYRFQALLKDCIKIFGSQHKSFLAWEIGTQEEAYLWGSLGELELESSQRNLKKGEFILILHQPSVK